MCSVSFHIKSLICLAVIGVATAGVLHGGHHGGAALYAGAPAVYAGHGHGHPDEGLDYHVSIVKCI